MSSENSDRSSRTGRPALRVSSAGAGHLSSDLQSQLAEMLAQFPEGQPHGSPQRGDVKNVDNSPLVSAVGPAPDTSGLLSPSGTTQFAAKFGTLDNPLTQTDGAMIRLITKYGAVRICFVLPAMLERKSELLVSLNRKT